MDTENTMTPTGPPPLQVRDDATDTDPSPRTAADTIASQDPEPVPESPAAEAAPEETAEPQTPDPTPEPSAAAEEPSSTPANAAGQMEHVATATAGDVKRALDTALDSLNALARTASQHGGKWGSAVAGFALWSIREVPDSPTLADLAAGQRAGTVGALATVTDAEVPGKYLIINVAEQQETATVVQASTGTLLTPEFAAVTPDPTERVFDPNATLG